MAPAVEAWSPNHRAAKPLTILLWCGDEYMTVRKKEQKEKNPSSALGVTLSGPCLHGQALAGQAWGSLRVLLERRHPVHPSPGSALALGALAAGLRRADGEGPAPPSRTFLPRLSTKCVPWGAPAA